MNITCDRAVNQRRDFIVQTVHACVNVGCRSLCRQLLASCLLVSPPQDVFRFAARLEDISLRVEAIPGDFGRVLAKICIFCCKIGDFLFDLFRG